MLIVLLPYLAILGVLAFMPGWRSFSVVVALIATALLILPALLFLPTRECSGQECNGQVAGSMIASMVLGWAWFLFLVVALGKAVQLGARKM